MLAMSTLARAQEGFPFGTEMTLEALPQAITFLNLPPSVLGPIQGLLFTGLVLVFMFFRPQGLVPAENVWRGRGGERR